MRWRTHNLCTLKLWHTKFVWWPLKVGSYWVWFEPIKRKGTRIHSFKSNGAFKCPTPKHWWKWEYMFPEDWGH